MKALSLHAACFAVTVLCLAIVPHADNPMCHSYVVAIRTGHETDGARGRGCPKRMEGVGETVRETRSLALHA